MEKRGGQELTKKTYVAIMPHDKCSSLMGTVPEFGVDKNIISAKCENCGSIVPIDWKYEMHNKPL